MTLGVEYQLIHSDDMLCIPHAGRKTYLSHVPAWSETFERHLQYFLVSVLKVAWYLFTEKLLLYLFIMNISVQALLQT